MTAPSSSHQEPVFGRQWLVKLLLCMGLVALTPVHADDASDYEARLEDLQENIQELRQELEKAQGTRDELQEELEDSESDIGELLKKIEKIEEDLKKQDQELQSLRQERSELQLARDEQQEAVAQQVRAAYQLGRQSQIKLMLNQESPERVSRILRYYDYFLEERSEKLNAYLATLNRLDQIEPRIAAQSRSLEENRATLRSRHTQLKQRQQTRQETLAALNSRISTTDQKLGKMQRDRQRLEALLMEMTNTIANIPLPGDDRPFSSRKGQLPWPTEGQVQHHFGSAQVAGKLQWNGVLIAAPMGRPVLAVHHGRVVFSDYFRGHGLLLIVDHGEGYMTLYAHNQSLFKETGEWVSAGEKIASVGNTGGRERAGLYFEIRQGGKPTDPAGWLAQA